MAEQQGAGYSMGKMGYVVAMVVVAILALAAVTLVDNNLALERLGMFFGIATAIVTALIGALKADQAARQTNGSLDARLHDAIVKANATRRQSDPEA